MKQRAQVYAVIRYDPGISAPENSMTVKEIVHSLELAQSEVERLNQLNGHKRSRYWWQTTRLYPPGVAAGPSDVDAAAE